MRIRPTELGLKGTLLLAALELAFLATSYSNLFFLLIVFCCALGALGLFGAIANLRGLEFEIGTVPLAPAETPRTVGLVLRGRRRRFDLAFSLENGRHRVDLGVLPFIDGAGQYRVELAGRPRGVFQGTHVRVASRHPFGLFEVSRRVPTTAEIATHPAPAAGTTRPGGVDAEREGHADGPKSPTVVGLRPFRSGDSPNSVHWKATARRGEPIVKERDTDGALAREIVIDRRCAPEVLETALAGATAAVLDAAARGTPVRLRSQDCTLDAGVAGPRTTEALRWLAGASTLPPDAPGVPRPAEALGV